jgi:glycerophosphoryl diester phosphodiesterase
MFRRLIQWGCVGTTLAVLATCARPAAKPDDKPFFSKQILLGAHRAGAEVVPESTVAGFKETAERWPDILLETDAAITADGHVVLLHDETVDRTTDGTGKVGEMTLAELKQLDAGYKLTPDNGQTYPYRGRGITIPTLEEVLEALPESHFLVETKPHPGIMEATIEVIRKAGAEDRVLLASFVPDHMDRARELAPDMAMCYDFTNGLRLIDTLRNGDWDAYEPEADVLSLMRRMVTRFDLKPTEIQTIRRKGVRFQIHTVNDPGEMRYWLDIGVDSILTDRPDLLAQTIQEWQEGR